MANVKLLFSGTDRSQTHDHELQIFANSYNEIFIQIDAKDSFPESWMCLDKATAIKLHRELKKQISFLNDQE